MTFSISATRGEANLAGWLTKAAAAFRGTSAAAPQPFHIGCECGGHVSGLRIATHQKVICLACQQPILVLPASPYPAVKRLIADAPRKKSPAVVQSDEQSPREPQAPTARQTRGFGKSSRGGNASAKNAKEQPPGVSQSTTAASTAQLDLSPA